MKYQPLHSFAAILCGLLLFSNCAIHEGAHVSSAAISNANFRIVGVAQGSAHTTQFLGIGGLGKDALVNDARNDLYSKYPLAKGMVLGNVTVDFKRSYLPFISTNLVTFTADIIDFNPNRLDFPYQGFYTDDSTFFPTKPLPGATANTINSSKDEDTNGNKIEVNSKVSFLLNSQVTEGKVIEKNGYGIKCVYQTTGGEKKIYLKSYNLKVLTK